MVLHPGAEESGGAPVSRGAAQYSLRRRHTGGSSRPPVAAVAAGQQEDEKQQSPLLGLGRWPQLQQDHQLLASDLLARRLSQQRPHCDPAAGSKSQLRSAAVRWIHP